MLLITLLQAYVIEHVEISGNQRIEKETILNSLGIAQRKNINQCEIDEAIKNLYATQYFADVQTRIDGKILYVKVVENCVVNKIAFEGNSKLKDERLKTEIGIKTGETISQSKVAAAQQRILEAYRRMGYFSSTVEMQTIALPNGRMNLIFKIYEGQTTHIKSIGYLGNNQFSSGKLTSNILSKEYRFWRFFANDDTYDPDRFLLDQELLREYYLNHGYADFYLKAANAELSKDRKDFYLTFSIDEGKQYNFDKVCITTSLPDLDPSCLKDLITVKKGDTFSQKELDKTVNSLTDAAGMRGYAFAEVEPRIEKNANGCVVNIDFHIKEGPRVYVERIDIQGNDFTHDGVIRRHIMLHEGDAYNSAKVKKSEQNIRDLGFFKKVEIESQHGSKPDTVIIQVKVEEQNTGEVGLSGGFSTLDGPLVNVRVMQRNFRGRGQSVHADFDIAKKRQGFEVGFTEPYFLNRDLMAGVDVFHTRSSRFCNYKPTSTGFNTHLGYLLSERLSQVVNYSLHHDRMAQVSVHASEILRAQTGTHISSTIGHTITYNATGDHTGPHKEPTNGYILSLSQSFTGLGGNVRYFSNGVGGSVFYSPIEEWVVSLRGNAGILHKVSKPIMVQYSYLLGYDSLRGFEYGGLGPRDSKTQDSLGGTRYWKGTLEMQFPLGTPKDFALKGAIFSDFGSVWKTGTYKAGVVQGNKHALRASAGFGISWTPTSFSPIRIDYAIPYKRKKFDQQQRIILTFSTRF